MTSRRYWIMHLVMTLLFFIQISLGSYFINKGDYGTAFFMGGAALFALAHIFLFVINWFMAIHEGVVK